MSEKIFLSPPHMSGNELKYIQEAFEQNWIAPLGPNVSEFEKQTEEYLGGNLHCVAMSSGTAAIHIALILLGVTPDDEVICSSLTFVASANPIVYLGAKPVFIDSELASWNMCPKALRMALEDKKDKLPKAIIAVDLFGQSANYTEIEKVAKEFGVALIEDAAESFGADLNKQKCGTFGDFGILSFNGNKIITTSGGGMLVCRTAEEKKKAIHLITQARDEADFYLHSEVGYNYRMSNICAGIGRAQVEVLDQRVDAKRQVNSLYKEHLSSSPKIEFMPQPSGSFTNHWLTALRFIDKDKDFHSKLIHKFAANNIDARHIWKPLHTQPLFTGSDFYSTEDKSISNLLFETGICLPSGSQLKPEQVKMISDIILEEI